MTRGRDPAMVRRRVASAWLLTQMHFRKVVNPDDFRALAVLWEEKKPVAFRRKSRKINLPAAPTFNSLHRPERSRPVAADSEAAENSQCDRDGWHRADR